MTVKKGRYISQGQYINNILQSFDMMDFNGVRTPLALGTVVKLTADDQKFEDVKWFQTAMGKLIYLATLSRPDICFVVRRLCLFMANPQVKHVQMVKRIFRYLKSTINYRLKFSNTKHNVKLYSDADYSNDQLTGRSITGVACFIYGNLID